MASDSHGSNIQTIAMLWRAFTTRLDDSTTYGDLIADTNMHATFELHEQPNDQFKVTWKISVMRGKRAPRTFGLLKQMDAMAFNARAAETAESPGRTKEAMAMTIPSESEGVPISRLIDTRHKFTALIKQNLYGKGSKNEGRAALIARNKLDEFVFGATDDNFTKGNSADLDSLKRAIIIETHTELLDILTDYRARFGRGGKATKQGMLAIVSDPDVFGRFNPDHQGKIQAIATGSARVPSTRNPAFGKNNVFH
jgi:hypothetical protein